MVEVTKVSPFWLFSLCGVYNFASQEVARPIRNTQYSLLNADNSWNLGLLTAEQLRGKGTFVGHNMAQLNTYFVLRQK